MEAGALSNRAEQADGAAVLLDDPAGRGQAQSRAAFLGGEVDLKDGVDVLRRDTRARVGDLDLHALVPGRGADDQLAAFRHGLLGVEDDVQQRLLEQIRVRLDLGHVIRQVRQQADVVLRPLARREVEQFLKKLVDVAPRDLDRRAPCEAQKLVERLLQAARLHLQDLAATFDLPRENRILVLGLLPKKLDVHPQNREGVLEFVRQPLGQGLQIRLTVFAHRPLDGGGALTGSVAVVALCHPENSDALVAGRRALLRSRRARSCAPPGAPPCGSGGRASDRRCRAP